MISSVLLDEAHLLNVLGISGDPATQTKQEWDEDELNPVTVLAAATGGVNSASTTLLLSASEYGRVTAGTLLQDTLSGKSEVLLVTARSTVSATVTRGYGSTDAESHANSATYNIIANARPQGMACPKDTSVARTRSYNYTQIFSKGVQLTGTAVAIKHNGISSEDSYQIDMRLRELMRELDRTVIMGMRAATNVADGTYGTMGGLIDFIKNIGGDNTNSTAETLTPSVINTMNKQVYDAGAQADLIVVGGTQKQKISTFDKEYRRTTLDARRAGFTIEEFVTDLGNTLRVVVDRWVPNDTCLILDSTRVRIMPLRTRGFFLEKVAKTGDFDPWQIIGEYTMEVKNADKAHAIHTNLKQ